MSGDEARHRANFCEQSNLVNLSDYSIHNLSFEWAENNSLVLHWIQDKTSSWLDYASPDVVNGGDSNNKAILASARSLHFCEELLLHSVKKIRTKISWM